MNDQTCGRGMCMRRQIPSALAILALGGTAQAQAPDPIETVVLNGQSSICSASADFIGNANDLP